MQNTLPAVENYDLQYVFDMKGSQINREVLKSIQTKDMRDMKATGGQVLKDLDYIRLKEVKRFFKMNEYDIEEIITSLSNDVEFLRSCRFMDYSILLAIRKTNSTCKEQKETRTWEGIKNKILETTINNNSSDRVKE
jgi:hypothetical protein